ncbi:hypothetical protein Hte_007791 [Hypoxylon texense]
MVCDHSIQPPELETVRDEAQARSRRIFSSFHTLRDVLDRHETKIRKRWLRKNIEQRKRLLLNAWPGMPQDHNPHVKAYRLDKKRHDARHQHYGHTEFRDAYMWPSVNLEDLVMGNTLLRLINARGRHLPGRFAQMDAQSTHLGVEVSVLWSPYFLLGSTTGLSGLSSYIYEMILPYCADTATVYGAIQPRSYRSYTNGTQGDDLAETDAFLVGDGMNVLEIQERLLKFLCNASKAILWDINLDGQSGPVVAEPPPLKGPTEGEWLSLDSLARSAPYSVPEDVRTADGLKHIKSLVSAHFEQTQERLWSLREDPAFFADLVGEFSEHQGERLPGRPRINIYGRSSVQRKYWDQTAHMMVNKCYEEAIYWYELDRQLDRIIQDLGQEGAPSKQQRAACHDAVRKIRAIMETGFLPNLRGMINIYMTCCPALRNYFCREEDPEAPAGWEIAPRPGAAINLKGDRLIWFYFQLQLEEFCDAIGWETLSFEFEQLLRDKTERPRISALVAWQFTNLGLLGLLQNQIRMCFPRLLERTVIREREHWTEPPGSSLRAWLKNVEYPIRKLAQIGIPASPRYPAFPIFLDLKGMADPTSGKFVYPSNKPRTKATVRAMQEAESNLDDFWALYDGHFDKVLSVETRDVLRKLLPANRTLVRTPDWVEPSKEEEEEEEAARDSGLADAISRLHVAGFQMSDDGTSHSGSFQRANIGKAKTKTRGASKPELHEPEAEEGSGDTSNTPVFEVKARVYNVFRNIFYMPTPGSQAGEVNWVDLLHAMHAIGFEPTKLHGSAWSFRPCNDKLDIFGQIISIHEPHPSTGPAGLTLARLLQKNGVRCKVFEGENDRHTREQGGSLDMHPDKGLLVIKEAGLYERFLEHARPEGDVLRILRSDGKVLLDEGEGRGGEVEEIKFKDGEIEGRPEIDRTKLRDILLESLEPDTIQWGHRLARVQSLSDQPSAPYTLEFASGGSSNSFDIVVGADGAWSRVRPLLTSAQPVYSGIGGIEVRITDIDARAPDLARRVGNGTCSSYGDNRALMSQRNGDGSVRTYAFVRTDAGWLEQSGIDFKGDARDALRRFVEVYFGDWEDEAAKAMVLKADLDAVVVRNIWMLPVGTRWAHRNGVTLIGDAAHVMPPFAGVGVNVAMQDALVLAKQIIGVGDLSDPSAVSRATRDYEVEMFDRAESYARETMQFQDMQFSEKGPYPLVEYFEQHMAAATTGTEK